MSYQQLINVVALSNSQQFSFLISSRQGENRKDLSSAEHCLQESVITVLENLQSQGCNKIISNNTGNVAGNIASNIADSVEHVQLSSNIARNFQLFVGEIDYNLAKR